MPELVLMLWLGLDEAELGRLCLYSLIQRILSLRDSLEIFILYGKRHTLHFCPFSWACVSITEGKAPMRIILQISCSYQFPIDD